MTPHATNAALQSRALTLSTLVTQRAGPSRADGGRRRTRTVTPTALRAATEELLGVEAMVAGFCATATELLSCDEYVCSKGACPSVQTPATITDLVEQAGEEQALQTLLSTDISALLTKFEYVPLARPCTCALTLALP